MTARTQERRDPQEQPRIRTLQVVETEVVAGLPVDPALPALAALRQDALAAVPALGLSGRPALFVLRGYTPGDRAAVEVRVLGVGGAHFIIKAYAGDPAPEAMLYEALAAAGLTSGRGVRVPRLLAWDRELKILVLEWLEGPPVNLLVKDGPPERAGELGARWLRLAAALPVRLGPPAGTDRVLAELERFLGPLEAAGPELGAAARTVARWLARNQPLGRPPSLVHGTLYTRHLIDLGGDTGPGIIDWQRFGQGPLELDAGTFLATLSRTALLRKRRVAEATQAGEAFAAHTRGLLDERALAWHEAAALLRLAGRMLRRRPASRAKPLVDRAARLAEAAR